MEYGAMDLVTPQDYKSRELFGSIEELPESVEPIRIAIENQGAKQITRMSCTRQSAGNAHKIQQTKEFEGLDYKVEFSNEAFWERAWRKDESIIEMGDYIVNGPKQLKDENRITGYYQCEDVEEMKRALASVHLICVGSVNGDWKYVREKKVYRTLTTGTSGGHAFLVVGYKDDYFYCLNSYGDNNGLFRLPFSEVQNLFKGKFAVIDKHDTDAVEALKDKKYILEQYPTLAVWQKGLVKFWTLKKFTVKQIANYIAHWKYKDIK